MSGGLRRRTALKVLAASAAIPLGIVGLRGLAPAMGAQAWRGESMGGAAGVTVWHQDAGHAQKALLHVVAEVERLERIFSLHVADSEISRLNGQGGRHKVSQDMATVLGAALDLARRSGGAFDPAVQTLWQLHAAERRPAALRHDWLERARESAGIAAIDIAGRAVSLGEGRKITLNAIAQGYITDRVADLLRMEGFDHALVEVGETRALGAQVDGRPFRVGLRDPRQSDRVDRSIDLADMALSVSGGYGFRFADGEEHILDPRTGLSPRNLLDVAVIAPRAMDADALSTAIYVAGEAAAQGLVGGAPGARAMLTRADGSRAEIGAAG